MHVLCIHKVTHAYDITYILWMSGSNASCCHYCPCPKTACWCLSHLIDWPAGRYKLLSILQYPAYWPEWTTSYVWKFIDTTLWIWGSSVGLLGKGLFDGTERMKDDIGIALFRCQVLISSLLMSFLNMDGHEISYITLLIFFSIKTYF